MTHLRAGIAGIGRMGKRHAENLAWRLPGVSLVAACSPVGDELAWARGTLGVVHTYERYDDLLADRDVDAVFIVTPNTIHPEQIVAALKAGKGHPPVKGSDADLKAITAWMLK